MITARTDLARRSFRLSGKAPAWLPADLLNASGGDLRMTVLFGSNLLEALDDPEDIEDASPAPVIGPAVWPQHVGLPGTAVDAAMPAPPRHG